MSETTKPARSKKPTTLLLSVILLLSIITLYMVSPYPYRFYGTMTSELKDSELFEDMQSGQSFCFLGDSITYGSATNGVPWYYHLERYIKGDVTSYSYGGWTVSTLIEGKDEIPSADIYVIAIGINDALCYYENGAASDSEEFIEYIGILTDNLKEISPEAKLYYITPWIFYGFPDAIVEKRIEYSNALMEWCNTEGIICIDPNPIILDAIDEDNPERYMTPDLFHPNAKRGVGLYSYAVLLAEHQRRYQ